MDIFDILKRDEDEIVFEGPQQLGELADLVERIIGAPARKKVDESQKVILLRTEKNGILGRQWIYIPTPEVLRRDRIAALANLYVAMVFEKLHSIIPGVTPKSPEDVVTAYYDKIAALFQGDIENAT